MSNLRAPGYSPAPAYRPIPLEAPVTGRILHTSDWHLGRQIGRFRRDSEVDAVLNEINGIADDFHPDLIVHSGDLCDSPRPGLDDMRRAAQALRRLGDADRAGEEVDARRQGTDDALLQGPGADGDQRPYWGQ